MLKTPQDVERKLLQRRTYVSNLIKERQLVHEAYEMIFKMIQEAEKGSRKHIVLLKIEDALDKASERVNKCIQDAKTSVLGLDKKHRKMVMGEGDANT